jgi:hypothetical protein
MIIPFRENTPSPHIFNRKIFFQHEFTGMVRVAGVNMAAIA